MSSNNLNTEFHKRFTKVKDALQFIEAVEKLDLSKISDDELGEMIDQNVPIFPYTSATIPAGTKLFRARLNKKNKPYLKTKDIFIPPIDKINEYGRANKPHEQIFYCASNFKLAAFEVIQDFRYSLVPQKEIAFLTIGIWKTKIDLHVASIVHSPFLRKIREDINEHYNEIENILNGEHHNREFATAGNLVFQFFADQFTKHKIESHCDYRISALYSRRLRHANSVISEHYQNEKFDGINYPSVAMAYKGDNQALFFETASEKLELVNAIQVVCGNIDFKNASFTVKVLDEAERIKNGNIQWKEEIYKT